MQPDLTPSATQDRDDGVRRASEELAALANLIERPPVDDVELTQDVALRSAKAIWTVLAALATPAQQALNGIADDYMTSEVHHPGYVLIPLARFEQLRAAAEALNA